MTRCSAVLQLNYLGRPRSTQRRELVTPDDEMALTEDIVRLAGKYGRYGYRYFHMADVDLTDSTGAVIQDADGTSSHNIEARLTVDF